jgi:hypothetical protein
MNAHRGRELIDRLRTLPLTDILRTVDARPNTHDPTKWHTTRGTLSVNGTKFFNWNENTGGGGAIDLAMHMKSIPFKQAVAWLESLEAAQPTMISQSPAQTSRALRLPGLATQAMHPVLRYLQQQRRLPKQILLDLATSGDLYADYKRNAVFLMRNRTHAPVGAELRGTGPRPWRGMAPGSSKNHGCFAVGPQRPNAVVLCESAIDAISCNSIHPEYRCISTAGARANPAWLPKILAESIPVYCGFDNDPTGNAMADAMIVLYPVVQRLQPPCHDWNEALTSNP